MKLKLLGFLLLQFYLFSQSITERIEKNILKEVNFQNIQIIISKTGPFIFKKYNKEILNGGFFVAQGIVKENEKIKFTHEEWQFNDFGGKLKGEIITETPLTIKIDSREFGKNNIGFIEEIKIMDKTIKLRYEFEINKETEYPVSIYINFNFPEEIIDKDIKPFIDEEKSIYETKEGSITISYSSDFLPDRFSQILWKSFRIYMRFPNGLRKGEVKRGDITISLP